MTAMTSGNRLAAEHRTRKHARRRTGAMMVELLAGVVMFSAAAVVLTPGIHAVVSQRKADRFETLLQTELNNLAERIRHRPAQQPQLSEWFLQRYTDAELQLNSVPAEGDIPLTQHEITIRRPGAEGLLPVTKSLIVWTSSE
ncbi:MAG: hypothetical protein KDA89_21010 [Planctomycetaceae bacterium]|nr:hypothetical protein [Planctomycetaceae bacterium]